MAQDGVGHSGPPRLSVVEGGAGARGNDDHGEGEGAPASGSPVHNLLNSIEEGTAASGLGTVTSEAATGPFSETVPAEAASPMLGANPDRREKLRILEAVIFAAAEPQGEERLATYLRPGDSVANLMIELQGLYAGRGVQIVKVAGKWSFRTAEDLSWVLERHAKQERRLSKAALETLAIVAYHQPVTRAEIEDVRGVTISKGTLDVLMEAGWVRPRGRRRAPGKPITYGTTERFLEHFGLDAVKDLPGLADLKAAGLLDANLPPDFKVPEPNDAAALLPDELPLEDGEDGDELLQPELELVEPNEDDDETAAAGDDAGDADAEVDKDGDG